MEKQCIYNEINQMYNINALLMKLKLQTT